MNRCYPECIYIDDMNTAMPRTPMAQTPSNWHSLPLVFVPMLTVHTSTSSASFLVLDERSLRLLPYRDLLLRPADLLCCHKEYAGYPGCLVDSFQINKQSAHSVCHFFILRQPQPGLKAYVTGQGNNNVSYDFLSPFFYNFWPT